MRYQILSRLNTYYNKYDDFSFFQEKNIIYIKLFLFSLIKIIKLIKYNAKIQNLFKVNFFLQIIFFNYDLVSILIGNL